MASHFYQFGPFELDAERRRLLREGEVVSITAKVFDLLWVLVSDKALHNGSCLGRPELIARVWPDTQVGEHNLNQAVAVLRAALGDNSRQPEYIATLPGRGYAFVAEVRKTVVGGSEAAGLQQREADFRESSRDKRPEPDASARARQSRTLRFAALAGLTLLAAIGLPSAYYVRTYARTNATPTSIAVLPFLNVGAAPTVDDRYLSDGVAEDLTTGLAQMDGLRVVAATSAFQFRGRSEDVRKIGEQLNAGALLEGSITQSGGRLRLDVQLINTGSGYHMWSKAYEVESQDLVASEQDIVQETAHALGLRAAGSMPAMKRDTENAEAHVLYLRGRYLWNSRQLADMQQSVELFERAIKDDPNYALAYAGLADTYTVMAVNAQMSPAKALPHAKAALQRALEIEPNLARAHATLGLLKSQCEWDWRGAEQEFRKATELEPNYAPAHHWAGLNYMEMGQFAAADREFRQAQVLDPLSPMITEGLAENFYDARRYDEAISTVRNMPNAKVGWVILTEAYILKGMYEEALKVPEVANPTDLVGLLLKAAALARSGDHAGAMKILEDVEHDRRNPGVSYDYIPPEYVAAAYAVTGDKERAFVWLEKAHGQHDPALANLKVDPRFDSLRADPRYFDLLKRVGLSD